MRKSFKSKLISSFMSATMVLSLTAGFTKFDSPVKAEAAATDYGLASNCQDGNILHCFGWKFSDIIDELPNIAAAGFTSVQTTPVQPHSDTTAWYWLYQPTYFTVGNDYCTADDVKRLCSEADKYGIKVIVDVVANHVAGKDGNYNGGIDPDLKNSECFTNSGIESKNLSNEDWKIRSNVVRCNIGMPDLNSNSKTVQNKVKNLVQELKSYGVDGIRWDAAKHIGLPSDGYSFWDNVIDKDMYNYGEILDSPGGNENAIMKEYSQYMTVTDNRYGNSITGDIRDGKTSSQSGNWINSGVSANKILNWGESHDTYCNDPGFGGWTKYLDESIIQRSYAVTAARANSNDLYFVRPYAKESNDIHYGVKGTESFKDAQIAAVNHLHNKMIGQNEYLTTGDNCDVVTRGNKTNVGGASIVNVKGGEKDFSVPNGGSLVPVGTYKDQVSGGTITVTASTISGHMGSTGIAVIYTDVDPEPSGSVSASLADGSSFENQTTVTLNCKDVKKATYSTSEGASGSYTDGKQITIGSSIAEGSSVKLTLKATKSDNTQVTKTYTYNKKAQKKKPTLSGPGFIYDNSKTNWSSVTAYVYDETSGTAISNAGWPGVQMTDAGDGYFTYVLDSKFANSSKVQVIFSNNGASQNPGSQQPGYAMTGSQYKIYENGAWSDYQNPSQKGTVTVKYVDESGNQVATSQTMTGNIGDAYTTSAATVSGYTLKTTPSNAAGKYTSSSITVTYVYSKVVSTDPVVTTSLADKSTFTTETAKTTLTLVNAVKGTYTIDNGITKEFTGSTEVVLGEGLVGNKDVTLDCTATDSKGVTKSYKYTFTKKFTVKKSTSAVAAASTASNSELPEKYYNTNGNGVGKEATIKIDGDASDWSEDIDVITAPLAKIGKSGGGNVTIPLQVNFGSDVSAPQYTNVARTLSATAYGGTAPYSYEFYVDGTKVATKSGSSTVSTAWTPTSAATHKIKCVVKDAAGNTVTSEKTFTAENKGTVVESLVNTSNVSQHAIVGQKVVLKGSATGGYGNYKFAYYYRRNSDKTWKVAGTEWGTSQFATFKPGYADVYEICIKVQDGSGTIIKKYLSLAANKTENNLECYGSVSKTMFTFGNTITIKGSAKNNSGAVKYKYEFRKASSWTFETIKDYSSSRSVSWKAPQKGSFTIRITADDGTNKAIRTINIKVK